MSSRAAPATPHKKSLPSERPVELLAPAGGPDAALAAFAYGADAVYLGLKQFSARADADNFGLDDLDHLVAYARSLTPRRRVFVAINTLVLQRELDDLVGALGAVADIGVDAVIVQDLGVAAIARAHFPELRLHASTQLAVHNRAGGEAARELGFSRVTLARELTLDEIRDVASVPGMEIESFLHGALCYSYSGLCLFSSQLIGRSGNRGQCAYPCRDDWRAAQAPAETRAGKATARDPRRGFAFSMKDLALPDLVPALRGAGVASLKIEGRKKAPLYVAATVDYYRRLLDGPLSREERARREADIKSVFSRPWTSLFLRDRMDKDVADADTVGHRGAPLGAIEGIVRSGPAVLVRFRTAEAIARHDGLQIDITGQGRPFGFGVDRLRVVEKRGAREVAEAPAGSVVEVELPEGYPTLPMGAPVYCSSSQRVKQRYRPERPNLGSFRTRHALRVQLRAEAARLVLEASGPRGTRATVEVEGKFEPARDPAKTVSAARTAFEKLGETRWTLGSLEVFNPEGRFAPVSLLNEARRRLAAAMDEAWESQSRSRIETVREQVVTSMRRDPGARAPTWSLKVDRCRYLGELEPHDLEGVHEVVVELAREPMDALRAGVEKIGAALGRDRVRLALPMITRAWEDKGLREKIAALCEGGWTRWEISNVSGLRLLGPREGLDLQAGWPMYAVNRATVARLADLGLTGFVASPEDGLPNLRELLATDADRATVVVYQDTPLFVSESCPYATLAGGCPGPGQCKFEQVELVSTHGPEVLAIDDRCRTWTINRVPLNWMPRLGALAEAGARRFRADFVIRPFAAGEVPRIWRALRERATLPGHLANFDRGLT